MILTQISYRSFVVPFLKSAGLSALSLLTPLFGYLSFKMFVFKSFLINTSQRSDFLVQFCRSFTYKSVKSRLNSSILPKLQIPNFNQSCATLQTSKSTVSSASVSAHDSISSIQLKKRLVRKKKTLEEDGGKPGIFNVVAFATAEEYDLKRLEEGLKQQDLYEPKTVENDTDVVHAVAKYHIGTEPREIFFFKEGTVVLWNITDLENSNILTFVKEYEQDRYSERLVQQESEIMNYKYHTAQNQRTCLDKNGDFVLANNKDALTLEKYTLSNSMVVSVKLGIWEASLEKYIDEIEFVTEDLKSGKKIKMTREEVLQKHGELFALRHYLNLSSDVLDTPDFYWENEELEALYNQVNSYFCINKRSRVMNEKINHCLALIEQLSTHLSDKHHTRLEWMIIILIMVEVAFEIIHYIDRYWN